MVAMERRTGSCFFPIHQGKPDMLAAAGGTGGTDHAAEAIAAECGGHVAPHAREATAA
jgi:hypothetical protein